MQPDSSIIKRRLVVIGILCFIILPLCIVAYNNRSNSFTPRPDKDNAVAFNNPTDLQDVLPETSFRYVIDRLNDYAKNSPDVVDSMYLDSGVTPANGTYSFSVTFLPAKSTHAIAVRVLNYDSTISTAVYIDNVLQRMTASSSASGITFIGMDELVNQSASLYQVQAVKSAFAKFAPNARTVNVDEDSVSMESESSGLVFLFRVSVDTRSYQARMVASGLKEVRLYLTNSSGQQVFDSGTIRGDD